MTIRHHPSEATLVAHAAGRLWAAAGPVVAAHAMRCPECRARLGLAEAVGGLLLEELPPAPLAPDALQRVMQRIGEGAPPSGTTEGAVPGTSGPAAGDETLPAILRRLGLPEPRLRWAAPGVRQAVLLREPGPHGGTLWLLRVQSGAAIPHHAHGGAELTCVLEGAFSDETGHYGPGDLVETELSHRPVAEGPADCVCLVAVQENPRFSGLLGRIVGPIAMR